MSFREKTAALFERWAALLRREGVSFQEKKSFLTREIHVAPWIMTLLFGFSFFWVLFIELGLEKESVTNVSLLVAIILFFVTDTIRRFYPEVTRSEEKITFLGFISLFTFLLMEFIKIHHYSRYIIPVPLAVILIQMLLSPGMALLTGFTLSLILSLIYNFDFALFLISFSLSLVALFSTSRVTNRNALMRAGFLVTLSEIFFIYTLSLFTGLSFIRGFSLFGVSLATGLGCSILVLGILPFIENFFDLVSDIRLLELSDFNQPLLKRLISEAPGTYHHSLLVASLAENAAFPVGANPILTRVGSYYHDIGKLYKPDYFIENTLQAHTRHKGLNPKISGMVITGHVKEGIHLSEIHKLPTDIKNFISQHHGTSLMHYFYFKALEKKEQESTPEEFRYPGPRPQNKEVALVMLADSVEAAVRSLEKPSFERMKDMVQKVINNKFIDGQLDECPLTLKDLHHINDSFIHTMTKIYHARIEYPEEEKEGE